MMKWICICHLFSQGYQEENISFWQESLVDFLNEMYYLPAELSAKTFVSALNHGILPRKLICLLICLMIINLFKQQIDAA